jgi:hypothetical protein
MVLRGGWVRRSVGPPGQATSLCVSASAFCMEVLLVQFNEMFGQERGTCVFSSYWLQASWCLTLEINYYCARDLKLRLAYCSSPDGRHIGRPYPRAWGCVSQEIITNCNWRGQLQVHTDGLSSFSFTANPDYQQYHRNGEAWKVSQRQNRNSL